MDPRNQPPDDTQFSPATGCIIMILAVVVLGGSAVYFVVQGFRMNREIDKFTVSQPVARPVNNPPPERREALRERIRIFAAAALAGDSTELSLSAADLNDLIAGEPFLSDFRGNTFVQEIDDDFIVAEMSQQLNSLKPGTPRYLNATFHLRPRQIDNVFTLALVDITGAEAEIPQGFIELYSQKKYFQLDPENEAMGPVLEKVTDIFIRNGMVTATTAPAEKP